MLGEPATDHCIFSRFHRRRRREKEGISFPTWVGQSSEGKSVLHYRTEERRSEGGKAQKCVLVFPAVSRW